MCQDILGPVRNGGVGTAFYYLATELARVGHRVEILFSLGSYSADHSFAHWVAWYGERGIKLTPCPMPGIKPVSSLMGEACELQYGVYEHLKRHADEYDLVHGSEWGADLYYCLLAKKLGLHFSSLHFVLKSSSPLLWSRIGNSQPTSHIADLPRIYMERRCIELADTVVSGSQYMLNWMRENGYELPAGRCFAQPNVFPDTVVESRPPALADSFDEIVFFGRLEPRKGLLVYLDALAMLLSNSSGAYLSQIRFTFLGKKRSDFDASAAIRSVLGPFGVAYRIVDGLGQPEALAYLVGRPGCLVVMPSLIDNSPFGVYEMLACEKPFITSNRGGARELIQPQEHERTLCDPTPPALSMCIAKQLAGKPQTTLAVGKLSESLADWKRWHETSCLASHADVLTGEDPLVSICLVTCNRPAELAQAIDSVARVEYTNIELIIVDDASDSEPAREFIDTLKQRQFDFPYRLIRQEKGYLGKARNRAAREAAGEYLLMLDDDNLLQPQALRCFVDVARRTDADILTCFSDMFLDVSGSQPPASSGRILFVGADLSTGYFRNPFGDSNCMIKRTSYLEIGGFSEEYKVGLDDQEFFARAVLRGFQLELIPESLYWYRVGANRMRSKHYASFAGRQRVTETYIRELSLNAGIDNLLRYAQGQAADEVSVKRLLARRLLRYNRVRRFMYRFPRLLEMLKPLLRKLL
ncbi:glycosyltransferase [Microbulbifer sp. 2205BS26-8]|uniref:glycosyltransferase n=1 Tax=Microbulbifer sp. 2205BS26-8 TaxID=3064386 RepID=UPI00273E429E|nr:glycosyltransferase [Microbulbifer sp. 2205BS26-8]MDP5210902.1 glycosyltransferase [Microbulbifer sp. 2205BS26-8]